MVLLAQMSGLISGAAVELLSKRGAAYLAGLKEGI